MKGPTRYENSCFEIYHTHCPISINPMLSAGKDSLDGSSLFACSLLPIRYGLQQ